MEQLVPQSVDPVNAYRDLHEQCVTEASFLWILRSVAIQQPHYAIEDIQELEQRIESWLDGLMAPLYEAGVPVRLPWSWKNQVRYLRLL